MGGRNGSDVARKRCLGGGFLVVVALTVGPAIEAETARAAAQANLKIAGVSEPPSSKREGASFVVADTVRNAGKGRARPSVTRYHLTTDPKRSLRERSSSREDPRVSLLDQPLSGSRNVPALARGRTSRPPRRPLTYVTVPVGTPPRTYWLLACADGEGAIAEAREQDNCRASKRTIKVLEDGKVYELRAFSDQRPSTQTPEQQLSAIQRGRSQVCLPGKASARELALASALASSRRFLTARAGADALPAFARSTDARDARKASRAALAAAAAGRPGAALAALLGAHQLQPAQPIHLTNAAAVASTIGLHQEALAFLAAAGRMTPPSTSPLGFNRHATMLTIRGRALHGLRRYADAEAALRAATSLDPLLRESAANLAATLACRAKDDEAIRFLRRSARRQDPPPPLDESQGVAGEVRKLPRGETPEQALALLSLYMPLYRSGQLAEVNARNVRLAAIATRRSQRAPRTPATVAYTDWIVSQAATDPPSVRALGDEAGRIAKESERLRYAFWGGEPARSSEVELKYEEVKRACSSSSQTACVSTQMRAWCVPAANSRHGEWLAVQGRLTAASQAYFAAASRRATGIVAYLSDPVEHAYVVEDLGSREQTQFGFALQQAFFWSEKIEVWKEFCVPAPDPPQPEDNEVGDPRVGDSAPCPPAVKGISLNWDLGPLALAINCESLTLGGSTPGWIGAFGEIGYDFRAGSVTIAGGAVGKAGVPGLSGDFKSGVYVTVSDRGLSDAGWRVGPSYTAGSGLVTYGGSDTIDLSFIPAAPPAASL